MVPGRDETVSKLGAGWEDAAIQGSHTNLGASLGNYHRGMYFIGITVRDRPLNFRASEHFSEVFL